MDSGIVGLMRALACIAALLATACPGSSLSGGGDDTPTVDAAMSSIDAPSESPDAAVTGCPLADTIPDAGMIVAFKAQRCNVSGTMGTQKWYRLSAQLPGSGDYVQLELWPSTGAFTGAVTTGTFTISGVDAVYDTCGVCGRALGDKAEQGQKEYFATAGTVNVTAVGAAGQPLSATLTNLSFVEVDATTKQPIASGCASTLAGIQISGTVMDLGGGGGGGGGGGATCPSTIGD